MEAWIWWTCLECFIERVLVVTLGCPDSVFDREVHVLDSQGFDDEVAVLPIYSRP